MIRRVGIAHQEPSVFGSGGRCPPYINSILTQTVLGDAHVTLAR